MSPERAGSPLAIEPRELALALQSAVPPFHMVRLHLHDEEANTDQAAAPSSASVPVTAGLQAPAQVDAPQPEDDDLTSLTWLQDNNLLKGMNLTGVRAELEDESDKISNISNKINNNNNVTPTKSSSAYNMNTNFVDQSPTSDYADESSISEPTDSSSSSLNSPVPYSYSSVKQQKHPQNVKYDPMVHLFSKPPYSFSCLIFMAIEDSPQKALPVKDIYAWILEHFPYFNNAPTGWKNSVRHNLSLNKCFQKVEKSPNLGKGSLWMVEQQYRPNLLQALTRSPFHPCSTLDPATFRSASTRTSSPFVQQVIESTKPSTRLPNPELFPYLSRRLAASEAKNESVKAEPPNTDDDSSLDDVDAATAILALKHGPKILASVRRRLLKSRGTATEDATVPVEMVQVITTSPSEDHTYSAADNINTVKTEIKNEIKSEADSYLRDDIKRESDVCSSPDEAFESDESNHSQSRYSSSRHFMAMDEDEQRKIEEGADALLNLAGISTLRNDHYTTYSPPEETHHEYSISSKRKRLQQDDSSRSNGHRRAYAERLVSETESFQPRLLRAKRKHTQNKHNVIYSSNNNIVSKKAKILASNEEWIKHKREVINQR